MVKKTLIITLIVFQLAMIFGGFLVNQEELISADKANRLVQMYERSLAANRDNALVGISGKDFRSEIRTLQIFDQRRRELIQASMLGLLLSVIVSFVLINQPKVPESNSPPS